MRHGSSLWLTCLVTAWFLAGCGESSPATPSPATENEQAVEAIRAMGGSFAHKHPQNLQLVLSGPQITDAGLEHLKGLTGLTVLHLDDNTQITDAGLEELTAALPKCSINQQPLNVPK